MTDERWRRDSNFYPHIFRLARLGYGSDIFKSSKVDNVGIDVGIATPSLAVQTLFPLPISLSAILNFGSLPTSNNVGKRRPTPGSLLNVKSQSGVAENVG